MAATDDLVRARRPQAQTWAEPLLHLSRYTGNFQGKLSQAADRCFLSAAVMVARRG